MCRSNDSRRQGAAGCDTESLVAGAAKGAGAQGHEQHGQKGSRGQN